MRTYKPNVCIMTAHYAIKYFKESYSDCREPDVVIIDEDTKQLPPYIRMEYTPDEEYKILTTSIIKFLDYMNETPKTELSLPYRMHPHLLSLISSTFYGGKLSTDILEAMRIAFYFLRPFLQVVGAERIPDRPLSKMSLYDGEYIFTRVFIRETVLRRKMGSVGVERPNPIIGMLDYCAIETDTEGTISLLTKDVEVVQREANVNGRFIWHRGRRQTGVSSLTMTIDTTTSNAGDTQGFDLPNTPLSPCIQNFSQIGGELSPQSSGGVGNLQSSGGAGNLQSSGDAESRRLNRPLSPEDVESGENLAGCVPVGSLSPYLVFWKTLGYVVKKTGFSNVLSPKGPCQISNFYIAGEDGALVSLKCFNDTRPEVFEKIRENSFYVLRGPGSSIRNANNKFNLTGHNFDILVNDDVLVEEYVGQPPFTLLPTTVKSLGSAVERVRVRTISNQEAYRRLVTAQGPEEISNVIGKIGQTKGDALYRACSNRGCCKTKVRERSPNLFFCPKCQTTSQSCTFGFLVEFELVTGTERQWV